MSDMAPKNARTSLPAGGHRRVAGSIVGVAVVMLGMSFAAVPLYRAFCAATGYGGTTQVSKAAPGEIGARTIAVRFDANVASDLPWTLEPEQSTIDVRPGQTTTVYFRARNRAGAELAAIAGYNVTPDQSGAYFDKISCFCFSEQRLGAGETAEWPVVFYLDPALEKDATMAHVDEITLSYVLYPSRAASAGAGERKF